MKMKPLYYSLVFSATYLFIYMIDQGLLRYFSHWEWTGIPWDPSVVAFVMLFIATMSALFTIVTLGEAP